MTDHTTDADTGEVSNQVGGEVGGGLGGTDIALVGMAGRFPGAADVAALWESVRNGRSGITRFTDEQLLAAGVAPGRLTDPAYVKAGAVIDGVDEFDAAFFGINPKEAQILDPQHRLFLEHSWLALEDAGCDPARFDGSIGVFGGCAHSTYLTNNLMPAGVGAEVGELAVGLANDKDSLALRVAHVLGLSGPAYGVQSYCSTSLVAVCVAAASLAAYECDMALAGGVAIAVPHRVGYLYQPGGIAPPDGECRAFDAAGLGAPLGNGVGVVALRRLDDALAAGDRIYAVLRGWAVNNDAGRKVGFTAPGVDGQARVIAEALAAAGLDPADLDYVEAHGTGTALGDAVELTALQQVFAGVSLRLGSVKTNVGHLDRAAGVTGLIKTALALHRGEIPPTRNLVDPNPALAGGADLSVVTERVAWPRGERPRLAGVSAFGIGGTNAHVVVQEAPLLPRRARPRRAALLVWSARSAEAADEATANLAAHLAAPSPGLPAADPDDVAHTLQSGRRRFEHRRMLVVAPDATAADTAQRLAAGAASAAVDTRTDRPVAFLIPGAGVGRATAQLHAQEPVFRAAYTECIGAGPTSVLRTTVDTLHGAVAEFAAGYALAALLRSWGVAPAAVSGAGPGAYVAACLAGVLTPTDALALLVDPDGATRNPATLRSPTVPVVCGSTGALLTAEQATDPAHWVRAAATTPSDAAAATLAGDDTALLCLGEHRPDRSGPPIVGAVPDADDARDAGTVLTEAVGRLWLVGVPVDWAGHQSGRDVVRVGLPGYPFQRQRYWIDAPGDTGPAAAAPAERAAHVELLVPRWTSGGPGGDVTPPTGRHLIVGDAGRLGDELVAVLRAGGADAAVVPAAGLAGLLDAGPVTVVHLVPPRPGPDPTCTDPTWADPTWADPAWAVLPVARTLAGCGAAPGPVRVVVVTTGGQVVRAPDRAVPAHAAVAPLAVVAGQEYLDVDARTVDLDPIWPASTAAAALAAELGRDADAVLVALRGPDRHLPGHVPAPASGDPAGGTPAAGPAARPGGTYLITGGLGDVGLIVAAHLAGSGAARLVLTSRTGLPDDPTDPRAVAVARLRAGGTRVDTPRADVTDPAAMRAILAADHVDGVVHAAASTEPETFRPLRDLDDAALDRHFRAKVGGAAVLAAALAELPADRAPRWCVLFSSTSALLGGITFGSYAAANAALGALAGTPGPTRIVAAAWDTWSCTLARLDGRIGATMAAHSMSDAEAVAAFDRLVAGDEPAVLVAAGGLDTRLPVPGGTPVAPVVSRTRFPRPDLPAPYAPPLTPTERALAGLWTDVLGVEPVGTHDNFFDLSGNSLLGLQMLALVRDRFGIALATVALFEAPTVHALAAMLDGLLPTTPAPPVPARPGPAAVRPAVVEPVPAPHVPTRPLPGTVVERARAADRDDLDRHIAIVGMAGRFPGAGDVAQFWRNLCGGVESVTFFTPDELAAAGVDPALAGDPSYVPARPVLDDITGFDAAFFGLSPRMAALTDPQQRLFLEVCWEAVEQAGYSRPEHRGRVGVYGGSNISTYLLGIAEQLDADPDVSTYEMIMGNDKDALTTTVSYLLDLRGPSVAVQTFCSTSLVATHMAVQSLRNGECEMALAGGVSIRVPDRIGHRFTPGGMESPDGHVRAFDAQARGSMFGDGATAVVLKRLGDALRDGDHIWSVIRGSALNNDGALKVGYTAPSVVGQATVIADAMADARVGPGDIGYVEAHGTGTPIGDPIEIAALTRAFGKAGTPATQYCPIGSVKTNIGHLDRAAGTAGLIKTSLVLAEAVIPPTLHYTSPNPQIDFEQSPFYVNAELSPWPADAGRPRIAGLNSLGMGGTNVHVVVEEPPVRAPRVADPDTGRRYQVLPVSARTATAADEAVARLGAHLRDRPDLHLADVAYTLQVGRRTFEHRRAAVVSSTTEAVATLTGDGAPPPDGRVDAVLGRPVAFLLAGVGEQYPGMVGELYRREPVFRSHLDDCLDRLVPALGGGDDGGDGGRTDLADLLTGVRSGGVDLAALLGRRGNGSDPRSALLERTDIAQPLMFAVDHAVASTLMTWGVRPALMFGYSLGEYVAACLAGVLSLDDALALVVHRARLIARLAPGAMVAVGLSSEELEDRFGISGRGLDIAAVNGPAAVVVAGDPATTGALVADLRAAEVACRPLQTTHAFHSRMLLPVADELTAWITENVTLHPPVLPYLSTVTGGTADAALVCDPAYWARHMCRPVQFATAAAALVADEQLAVVEIGPGPSLGALLRTAGCPPQRWPMITSTLPGAGDPRPADAVLADCLARLWLLGVEIDWTVLHGRAGVATSGAPGRVPLPTYPFQRQRYWIERSAPAAVTGATFEPTTMADIGRVPRLPEEQWVNVPVWRRTAAPAPATEQPASWLVFAAGRTAEAVAEQLRGAGTTVTVVRPGTAYRSGPGGATVRPGSAEDLLALLRDLRTAGVALHRAVHLWTVDDTDPHHPQPDPTQPDPTQPDPTRPDPTRPDPIAAGLHTLVALARAAGELGAEAWSLDIVSTGTQQVAHPGEARPDRATVTGPALVVPLEYPSVTTRVVDVDRDSTAADIVAELRRPRTGPTVALRRGRRWVPGYEVVAPGPLDEAAAVLRDRGVYLITGGLGGIGLGMAGHLARDRRARLVLFGRSALPPRDRWAGIVAGTDSVPDRVRSRVQRVVELLDLGAEVEIVAGDVADPADLRRAVDVAQHRFGALHGVLHTAGVPGTGLMQFTLPGDAEQVLAPKVAGTRALVEALRGCTPDFVALFSSITSVTGGGPGQVAYCAANAFLDAAAAELAAAGTRAVSVGWGEWTWNAWDSGLSGYDEELQTFFRRHRAEFGITFAEGWRSLLRALACGEPHVIVSTQDLPTVVRFSTRFTVAAVTGAAGAADAGDRHPRPELVTPFQEPCGPTEETIADAWCRALRLQQVGAADNFFELGGSSLLGINLLAELRTAFAGAELPPHVLHEAPTVTALAGIVDAGAGARTDSTQATAGTGAGPAQDTAEQGRLRRSGLKAAAARRRRP